MTKYTYLDKRKCLHCGEPIPDQKHLASKFCDHREQGKTSAESCKNKYWTFQKRKEPKDYCLLVKFHKQMNKRISQLLKYKGDTITREDLNKFGINLNCPVKIARNDDGKYTFFFIGYILEPLANNNFKIKTYGNIF